LAKDVIPVQQRRYRINPNYAAKVKEEIDKLLRVGFIRLVKRAIWLSPIVVVPMKNGKLLVCVVVVYAVHPFKIIKYGDAYHTCGLALYVHRAGFEPYTSTFSSRSFFFTHSFFLLMHT
jgi:hypothetical protein